MPQVNIFRWRAGNGWLVLSGGGAPDSEDVTSIDARMLGHTVSQGPLAYVWAASDLDSADRHMDLLRDLGARTGYLVDIVSEEDDTLFRQLSQAGMIILGDGPNQQLLREGLVGVAQRGIEDAFSRGATVYAVGQSAAVWGAYTVEDNQYLEGFGWLAHAVILPHYVPEHAERLRAWVQGVEDGYGLGLGQGAALALGPRGEVEVWGNARITVSLGQSFDTNS